MRTLTVVLLTMACVGLVYAQSTAQFERVGQVAFSEAEGPIKATRLLDYQARNQSRIVLVGKRAMRVVDVTTANVIQFRALEIPDQEEENPRVISPDGRRLLVFGNYHQKEKKNTVLRPAAIWDLETGKQITTLERPTKMVRAGLWTQNGKILATSSDRYAPGFNGDRSIEISFWDGETFKYLSSLPADKVNWWHLTDDGSKCLFSTAPIVNWFFIDRFIGDSGSAINLWDTRQGRLDQTLPISEVSSLTNTRGIEVSPDRRFLTYIAEKPKAKDIERRLVVRELDRNGSPVFQVKGKYELPPSPKLPKYGVQFSDDGEYFAFDAGKTLQIYETKSGQKKFELRKDETPTKWVNDNKILLYNEGDEIVARDITTGAERYRQKVVYVTYTYYANTEDTIPVTETQDYTRIVPHPDGKMFLTYSAQYVKVHDAVTGAVLQTLVEPPIDTTKPVDPKKGPRLSNKSLVSSADWTAGGDGICVISYDERSVLFWRRMK